MPGQTCPVATNPEDVARGLLTEATARRLVHETLRRAFGEVRILAAGACPTT